MELYLHFGLYKTGSSFLQTICARNRDILMKDKIFFPASQRDEDMIAGKISPGNGNGIALYLQYGRYAKVEELLNQWYRAAKNKGCKKILISDEALIHGFVSQGALKSFHNILTKVGFTGVYGFAFFRDPIDHCISTYKHRAKKGLIPVFDEWLESGYETMIRIREFLDVYQTVPFHWLFRKYQRDSLKMTEVFFQEWLQVDQKFTSAEISVNPSLTLSEISVIKQASFINSRLPFHLYDRFIELPVAEKSKDIEIENAYRALCYKKLSKDIDVVNQLNEVLSQMGSETLAFSPIESSASSFYTIHLSREQVNAIFVATEYANKYHVSLIDKLKVAKRKIKRKIKQYRF